MFRNDVSPFENRNSIKQKVTLSKDGLQRPQFVKITTFFQCNNEEHKTILLSLSKKKNQVDIYFDETKLNSHC